MPTTSLQGLQVKCELRSEESWSRPPPPAQQLIMPVLLQAELDDNVPEGSGCLKPAQSPHQAAAAAAAAIQQQAVQATTPGSSSSSSSSRNQLNRQYRRYRQYSVIQIQVNHECSLSLSLTGLPSTQAQAGSTSLDHTQHPNSSDRSVSLSLL
jgi:hypothetical protein